MLLHTIYRRLLLISFIGLSACMGPSLETPDEEPIPEPEVTTVVSVLAEMPEFSTFSAALESTGLNTVLEGAGPFTLFAPTNDALDILDLDLASLTPDQMADLLQYHIIAGEMTGNAAENTSWSNTLLQERIHLDYIGGNVVIDGLSTLTDVDIVADNGLIHVLDGVLLPTSLRDRIDLIQIVSSYPRLSKFKELMDGAGQLALDLGTADINLTLFAVPNRGFNQADIDPDELNSATLTVVGRTHAVDQILDSEALEAETEITTLSGETLTIGTDGDLTLNETSKVVYADISVNNGILHIIDLPISTD